MSWADRCVAPSDDPPPTDPRTWPLPVAGSTTNAARMWVSATLLTQMLGATVNTAALTTTNLTIRYDRKD